MSHVASASLARQLGSLFEGGSAAGLSDRQLLERFTDRGASRPTRPPSPRWWPDTGRWCWASAGSSWAITIMPRTPSRPPSSSWPDRPGRSATPTGSGTWLYGVALRTARKARGRLARRRRTEEDGSARQAEAHPALAEQAVLEREQAEALHREIDRLPGAFRMPVVLCYFEGLTLDEAAHRLRWPVGTLRSRLARAREKLRRGLTRRGFALSTTAMAAALRPGRPRRPSHPSCAIPPPGPRSASRPVTPPAGRSRPRRGPGPGGPPYHAAPQAEARRARPAAPGRRRRRRRLARPPIREGEPRRAGCDDGSDGASPSRRHRRCGRSPGPRPDDGRRPRPRPGRQAGAERLGDGLRGGQAGGRRAGRERTRTARPGGLRRLGPVSARHAADLVGDALHDRCRGPRAGIRHGLGRPGRRRRPAGRRHRPPARAGDRGAAVRHQGAGRAGRPRRGRGHGPSPARSGSQSPRVHRRSPLLGRGLREDPAGLAGVRDQRRRGPLHHPRRRPRPARPAHGR